MHKEQDTNDKISVNRACQDGQKHKIDSGTGLRSVFLPQTDTPNNQSLMLKPWLRQKKQDMTFEQAMAELESIVTRMETGNMTLDETVASYTRGKELTAFCQKQLDAAGAKLKKLSSNDTLEPLNVKVTGEEIPF